MLAPLLSNSERQLAVLQEERREARAELDRAHDALDVAVDEREELRHLVRQVIYPFFTIPVPVSPAFEEYHERGRFHRDRFETRRRNNFAGKENQPDTPSSCACAAALQRRRRGSPPCSTCMCQGLRWGFVLLRYASMAFFAT